MKIVILFLAAALGSASPARTQNSIQSRDGQKSCDCSQDFRVFVLDVEECPAGYEDVSRTRVPRCVQIGCSAKDYEAQCDVFDAEALDAKPATNAALGKRDHESRKSVKSSRSFQGVYVPFHRLNPGAIHGSRSESEPRTHGHYFSDFSRDRSKV